MSKHLPRPLFIIALSLFLLSTLPGPSQSQGGTFCANPSLVTSASVNINSPRALVVDDFNNDGKPDVVVGRAFTNQITILLGNGSGGFATPTNITAGNRALSLASADFNGDGNKDLLIGNEQDTSGEATIVLGNGAGGFGLQKGLSLSPGFSNQVPAVATGDMNGDTKQDLILLMTNPFGGDQIIIMVGDGANNFSVASTSIAGGTFARDMAVADMNGDSKLDVVATTSLDTGRVSILLGDGTGNLALPINFVVGFAPTALSVDDFSGDGKKDVAVTISSSDEVSILLGDGAGNLASGATISNVGDLPQALAKGDFDLNGALDLVVTSSTPGTAVLLLNQGTGAFVKTGNFSFGAPLIPFEKIPLAQGDFNGDSRPDVFVVHPFANRGWTLLNQCDTVAAQTTLAANSFAGSESVGPDGNAGNAGIVVSRVGNISGAATVDFNTSNGTAIAVEDYVPVTGTLSFAPGEIFKTVTVPFVNDETTEPLESFTFNLSNATGSSTLGSPNTAQIVILDEDPAPQISISDVAITEGNTGNVSADLLVTLNHPSASSITVQYQTVDGSATAGSDYQGSSGTVTFAPRQVAQTISVPINTDSSPEITETFLVNLSSPTNATIADSQGVATIRDDDSACPEPTFGPVTEFTVGTNPFDLVATDFNGDGKTDLATANLESANVSLLIGNGNGGFAPAVHFPVHGRPGAIAAGDFNSDNKPDLVVIKIFSNSGGEGISILLNDGAGGFSPATSTSVTGLFDVAVADFNGDSKLDLTVININSGSVSIMFGDGSGGFGPATTHTVGTSPVNVQAVNINADTKPDIVVANQNSQNISVLLNNGDGTFGAVTNFSTGQNPQSISAGDINSDGKIDLVIPLFSDGAITVLLGDGTGGFSQDTNLSAGVRSERTVLADLNSDGFLDLAVSDVSSDFVTPVNPGVWVLFGNGTGKFTSPTQFSTSRSPYTIVAGHFDAGSRLDLAFVQLQSSSVGVLLNTCSLSLPGPLVQFNASRINIAESAGSVSFNVVRSGNTQLPVNVDFRANDQSLIGDCSSKNGTASSRCDYLATFGTLTFAPNETSKTLSIPIVDDGLVEGDETFSVLLIFPFEQAGEPGSPSTLTITILDNDAQTGPNPIDVPEFFVRQQYIDFLNREPDQSGLDFWIGNFTQCAGDPQCIEVRRINVSAAFFLSIEFQQTGYLVERIYKTAYGDRIANSTLGGAHQLPVPIIRLDEFLADAQKIRQGVIVGEGNWEETLESNKQQFVQEFVTRTRFIFSLPLSLTPAQFVDHLNSNAGNPLSQNSRDQLVAGLTGGQLTRAQVLRAIAEDPELNRTEFNRAFVLMQYFGYLRRNPDDLPDSDYTGYDFWLAKLNQFDGDFIDAEMVKAFITSVEYRQRFGP